MSGDGASVDRWGDRGLRLFWRRPAADLAERTRRRVTLHLVPYLFFLYIIAYIDRMNVAVAGLAMQQPVPEGGLGFSTDIIGLGTGIFFWSYWILEIPSTNWVERRGARWVFVRILILWGIVAALTGAIGSEFASRMFSWIPQLPAGAGWYGGVAHYINGLSDNAAYQFYFFRFWLGFFEGGFFPSVIVYLSHWFRQRDRAKAIAVFALAMPLSSVIGYTFNAFFLRAFAGWRMIFVIEGILPVLAGIATIFLLPDRPNKAPWLADNERQWLLDELEQERQTKQKQHPASWVHVLPMILLLTAVYFFQNMTSYGLSTFMPAVMGSQVGRFPVWLQGWLGFTPAMTTEEFKTQAKVVGTLIATLPYYVSFVALLVNGWHSDRTGERVWHAAVPMAMCSIGLLLASALVVPSPAAILVLIFVVGACVYTLIPPFWSIPTMFLGASVAASAIGFINMIGNLGSGVGPMIIGKAVSDEQGHTTDASVAEALRRLWPWSLIAAALVVAMDVVRRWQLRRHSATTIDAGSRGEAPTPESSRV